MNLRQETLTNTTTLNLETAAQLTAAGFGRKADSKNYHDTKSHLQTADRLQVVYDNNELVAFTAYKRLLWRPSS